MFKSIGVLVEGESNVGCHNVIIVGSGLPDAGLYGARAMLEPLMFAGTSGGQLMLTSDIDFPGYPEGIGGPEMMIQCEQAGDSD